MFKLCIIIVNVEKVTMDKQNPLKMDSRQIERRMINKCLNDGWKIKKNKNEYTLEKPLQSSFEKYDIDHLKKWINKYIIDDN